MKSLLLSSLLLSLLATSAQAFEVHECNEVGVDLTTLVQPVAQNSRTFASGAISVYNIDTEEPAAASAGIAVVLPAEEVGAKCFAVIQLTDVNVMQAKASYDSQKGLLLTMPTKIFDGIRAVPGPLLKLRINQKTSTVTAE